ncbi:MAG TPA: hypothetical protein VFA15_03010 [Nitrososphaera sp.]|nr:hypothetical protein [Nitrososphaera sp.]
MPWGQAMTAILALIAAIVAAFIGSLVTEHHRRFREAQSIASAIAGELTGYQEASDILIQNFSQMKSLVQSGAKLPFKPFDPPKDVLYGALADKIGLLGPVLARDVAYVYQRLYGFRVGFMILTRDHESMASSDVLVNLAMCEDAIKAAQSRGKSLIEALTAFANEDYTLPSLPKFRRARPVGSECD